MSKNSHSMHSTIHNACAAQRRWLFWGWLVALPLFGSASQLFGATPPESPFSLYITTNMKEVDESGAVDQVSVLDEHRAILKCTTLTPGKMYRNVWSLKDADGKELLAQPDQPFTASESHGYVPTRYIPPDRIPKAGKWTWRVTVEGQGTFSKQITALPPTEDQAAQLATFQQVRENILHVFALSWRFYDDSLFTLVGGGTAEEKLIQVAGAKIVLPSDSVSPADALNGIKYRGRASFSFQVWREFTAAEGWTEWEDVGKHLKGRSERFGASVANVPENFAHNFNIGFVVYLKGGTKRDTGNDHCRVKSDDGAEFYDRRRTKQGAGLVQSPTKAFVVKALNEGGSLFKRERAEVQKLRTKPENTVEDMKDTTDAMRSTLGPLSSMLFWDNAPAPSFDQ